MNVSAVFNSYQAQVRKIATAAAEYVDQLTAPARSIRSERTDMVLGGDAWPGLVPVAARAVRATHR
ncbi:hypothetical protein [Terrihabitans rhizophilus]|jgi:hypothetical protein|uniref:Uncharacterized protein n=1 Tax=Terrihabitans rhizophilus TaxID=3092662 RepID=A0ABU4RPM9_9HYPH|nr:hypothetical protein [Terrihabitans sp. PJ23]MDX6806561.1 hypothetical protein [Terrihabitans sp. PJ23]